MAYDDGLFGNEEEVVKPHALNLTGRECGKYYPKTVDIDINEFLNILNEAKDCEHSKYDIIIDKFINAVETFRIIHCEPYIDVIIENIYSVEFMDRLTEKIHNTIHTGTKCRKIGILTIYNNNYEYPGIYWSPQNRQYHTELINGKYKLVKTVYPKITWEEINEEILMREKGYVDGVQYTLDEFNKIL